MAIKKNNNWKFGKSKPYKFERVEPLQFAIGLVGVAIGLQALQLLKK